MDNQKSHGVSTSVTDIQEQKEKVQKKTFQRWLNFHLKNLNMHISDQDLSNARRLSKFLKALANEHCLENLDEALQYLEDQGINLESKNRATKIPIMLIWTTILHFQIKDITVMDPVCSETKYGKNALLRWCQMQSAHYNNVHVQNFTTSWADGLAFNALIHYYRPDLLDFDHLTKANSVHNLNKAFSIAEEKLGVAKLIDPEDMVLLDEISITTYVLTYYKYFNNEKLNGLVNLTNTNSMVTTYNERKRDLLAWINLSITSFTKNEIPNSLANVEELLSQLKNWQTKEKPGKLCEKALLGIMPFKLNGKNGTNDLKLYKSDIKKRWILLDETEQNWELTLKKCKFDLLSLEKLAAQLYQKITKRKGWIKNKTDLLSQDLCLQGYEEARVALQKHEAIERDIKAYEKQVKVVTSLAENLETFNYFDIKQISDKKKTMENLWSDLLMLLENRKFQINKVLESLTASQEVVNMLEKMEYIKLQLLDGDFGNDFVSLENLIQKHKTYIDKIKQLTEDQNIDQYDSPLVFAENYNQVITFHQFLWKIAEEACWIKEKLQITVNLKTKCTLGAVQHYKREYTILKDEVPMHEQYINETLQIGDSLIRQSLFTHKEIQEKCTHLTQIWKQLLNQISLYKSKLDKIKDYNQLLTNADDIDSWLADTLKLLSIKNTGSNEVQAESLLKQHKSLKAEIDKYKSTIDAFHRQADEFGLEADILDRLALIDNAYQNIVKCTAQRQDNLLKSYNFLSKKSQLEYQLGIHNRRLDSMVITSRNIEDLDILKVCHDTFSKSLNLIASSIDLINQCNTNSVGAIDIIQEWERLLEKSKIKEAEINAAIKEETVSIQCHQTLIWIESKLKDLQDSKHKIRDKEHVAMQAKLNWLQKEANATGREHLKDQTFQIQVVLDRLEALMHEVEDHQSFLEELSKFQSWLTATYSLMSSETNASSLIEAKRLLNQHKAIKEQTSNRTYDYLKIITYIKEIAFDPHLTQQAEVIERDWKELSLVWDKRQDFLLEDYNFQIFERDARQAELSLNKQEQHLSSLKLPSSLEEAEEVLSHHEAHLVVMDAYKININEVLDRSKKLCESGHFASDKIRRRAGDISERRLKNIKTALEWNKKLNQQVELYKFLRDCDELKEKINTCKRPVEININASKLQMLQHNSEELVNKIPDSNKLVLFKINELKHLCQKQHNIGLMEVKKPLSLRHTILKKKKKSLHFCLEVELELFWMTEKMCLAKSLEFGTDLSQFNTLQIKNNILESEVNHRKARIDKICDNGQRLIDAGCEDSNEFCRFINELHNSWKKLKESVEKRKDDLLSHEKFQHFMRDAFEVESWIGEQELYMMEDDIGEDQSVIYSQLENIQIIDSYVNIVQSLKERSQALNLDEYPLLLKKVNKNQSQVESLYAKLTDLALKRKTQLQEASQLLSLKSDIKYLEQWINDKKAIASNDNLGQNYEDVIILCQKIQEFAEYITIFGSKHVNLINSSADNLISTGHLGLATITEWKNDINESWQELFELIRIRTEMLNASKDLYKFFNNCQVVVSDILKQQDLMGKEFGSDTKSSSLELKWHQTFMQDIQIFHVQIGQIQRESAKLQVCYAGDKAQEIICKELEVESIWNNLQQISEQRKNNLIDINNLHKFLDLMKSIDATKDLTKKMQRKVSPCDVAGAKLLIDKHQLLKFKIDALQNDFIACESFGEELLSKNHFASEEVKEKLIKLNEQREAVKEQWNNRLKNLHLILEVSEFAQDAFLAEQWLITNDSYIKSDNLGENIDEINMLIRKHDRLKKRIALQDEKFKALRYLTRFEIIEDEQRTPGAISITQPKKDVPQVNDVKEPPSISMDNSYEGSLVKKCETQLNKSLKSQNKWKKVYAVIKNNQIYFYKDAKHANLASDKSFKKDPPLELEGACASVAVDYKKRKHVLRVTFGSGCKYLFQAPCEADLNEWISHINNK